MSITIRQFLEGRELELRTAHTSDTVRVALATMIDNDFTLLPVIDSIGKLTGVISERSITRTYFHSEGAVALLDLTVEHCQEPATTLTMDDSLSGVLRCLRDDYAVVVIDHGCPVAILTDYDTNQYFQQYSEDLMCVERIERKLRAWVQAAFPDEQQRREALKVAKKATPPVQRQKRHSADWMVFNDVLNLVVADEHWSQFRQAFESRELTYAYLDQVRELRNRLAHFGERLSPYESNLLRVADEWMKRRPNPPVNPGSTDI